MNNYAIMVDAGYVFAEGSKMMFGDIVSVHINGEHFCKAIYTKAEEHFTETLQEFLPRRLRMYWYDAKDRSQWIAQHPGVTLRLGRVNQKGSQKGVDGAIIRDMLMLGQNRAISDIFLLSGDEDLIEGVSSVKDLGIRVHFMRIRTQHNNVSYQLLNEADGLIDIVQEDMQYAITSDNNLELVEPVQTGNKNYLTDEMEEGLQYLYPSIVNTRSCKELLAVKPRIPMVIDKMLFKHFLNTDSPSEVEKEKRTQIRGAFWQFMEDRTD